MEEEKTEAKVDLFVLGEVPVTVSYPIPGVAPISFFLRPYLNIETEAARQAFFALTDEERQKQNTAHNIDMLARLSVRPPEGLLNFPATENAASAMREFFGDGNPMKEKVVADVLTRYYRVTQPAEFFRGG